MKGKTVGKFLWITKPINHRQAWLRHAKAAQARIQGIKASVIAPENPADWVCDHCGGDIVTKNKYDEQVPVPVYDGFALCLDCYDRANKGEWIETDATECDCEGCQKVEG